MLDYGSTYSLWQPESINEKSNTWNRHYKEDDGRSGNKGDEYDC